MVQQHPTEPRFKLDLMGGQALAGGYVSMASGLVGQTIGDSVQLASLMLEQPVRVAIHAESMLRGLGG